MATSSNSYGTSTGIERLIGDIVVSRSFTTTTVPTLEQVELVVDDMAAELNRELSAAGYSVPVSTGANPNEALWLKGINEKGAAAVLLGTIPLTAIVPGGEDAGSNRMEMYQHMFNAALTTIKENRIRAGRIRGRLGAVHSGSQTDTNDNRKKPFFTRGDNNTPSLRKLTE